MKRKLFLLLCALLTSVGMWAQKDVTSLYITNATLSNGTNGWTNVNFNNPVNAYNRNDKDKIWSNATVGYASECYAGWGSLEKTEYSLTQDITLPAGHYTLVNYSFFRYGLNADTDASKSLAYLKAGSNQVAIKTLGSITPAGYANSQWEGAGCFDSKMYRNTLDFTIDADNTVINIGLVGTFDLKQSWIIAGMFELINNDIPATMDAPFDVTGYITNPGFEYRNMSGWTVTPSGYFGTQNNDQAFKTAWYYAEKWQGSGALPEGSMSQTLTDLPAGYYKLTANLGGNGTYIDLNGKKASWTSDKDYTVGYVLAEDEDLTITAGKTSEGTANWIHFDNFRLQFCGDVQAALTTLLNTAKDQIDNTPMSSSARSALQTAYDTYNHSYSDVDELLAAIDAMQDALDEAQLSINVYANINTAISTYAAKAASLDAAGQAAYDDSDVDTKYTAGSYATVAEAEADLMTDLATATKVQTSTGNWTTAIINPSFELNDFSGWTNNDFGTQGNKAFTLVDGDYYAEAWQPNGTKSVYQTISALPAGVYTLSAAAYTRYTTSAKISANGVEKKVTVDADASTYSVTFACEDNSNVVIGFEGVGTGATDSWLCVDNFTLTRNSVSLPDLDAVEGAMNGSVATAQTNAVNTYNSNKTVANYNAAAKAIADAEYSVAAYSQANAALTPMASVVASTNFYTSSVLAANYTDIKDAYDAGTLTDDAALAYTFGSRSTGNMPTLLLSAWEKDGVAALTAGAPYINTWSTEGNTDGSGMTTPFFEYWTGDANQLDATSIVGSLSGLTANSLYNVSALVRVRQQNEQTKADNGITFKVGDGAAVSAVDGTVCNTSFYYKTVSAFGMTDASGNLTVTFTVNENSHISWLAFKNVVYTEIGNGEASNLDFATGAVTDGICIRTYAKDITGSDVSGLQDVSGWVILNNGDARAAGVVNADGGTKLGGNNSTTPSAGYDALSNNKMLAIEAVWSSTAQYVQGVTLPAGNYRLIIPIYNDFGGAALATNLFGFVESDGTAHYATTTAYTVGEWTEEIIEFTLSDETTGYLSLGYIAAGSGDGNMPHLYVDRVMICTESATMQVSGTAKIGTFCAPFDVAIPEGVTAYEASMSSDEWVHLEEIENGIIDAGKPVILSITANEKFSQTFYGANTAENPDDSGVLKGLYVAESKASGANPYYILQYVPEDGAGFYQVPTGQTRNLAANRCYLQPESAKSPARIAIGGEDDPTAINEVEVIESEAKTMKDGKYFVKGRIVIVKNGKAFSTNGQKLN